MFEWKFPGAVPRKVLYFCNLWLVFVPFKVVPCESDIFRRPYFEPRGKFKGRLNDVEWEREQTFWEGKFVLLFNEDL